MVSFDLQLLTMLTVWKAKDPKDQLTCTDASVTQSALEEALASKMNAGSMASRMSSISHALRSRYL